MIIKLKEEAIHFSPYRNGEKGYKYFIYNTTLVKCSRSVD